MNGYPETPDNWIERRDEDIYPPMSDAEMCENHYCDHVSHCEECGRGLNYDCTITGRCAGCEVEAMAARQLTYTPPSERVLFTADSNTKVWVEEEWQLNKNLIFRRMVVRQ